MAQKTGRVSSIEKDGWAMVVTEKGDACNNCESAQFCHSLADCSRMETRVINRANARVGDRVTISLSSSSVFKSAMILYLMPTLSLFLVLSSVSDCTIIWALAKPVQQLYLVLQA